MRRENAAHRIEIQSKQFGDVNSLRHGARTAGGFLLHKAGGHDLIARKLVVDRRQIRGALLHIEVQVRPSALSSVAAEHDDLA